MEEFDVIIRGRHGDRRHPLATVSGPMSTLSTAGAKFGQLLYV
jgi:hypothetical protein